MRWLHQRIGFCLSVLAALLIVAILVQSTGIAAAADTPSTSRVPGAGKATTPTVASNPTAKASENPTAPCDPGGGEEDPKGSGKKTVVPPRPKDNVVRRVMKVQDRHTRNLLAIDGVVGVGTGVAANGDVVVRVFTLHSGVGQIPARIEGVLVEAVKTGQFRPEQRSVPRPRPRATVPSTHDFLRRPVPIGVSISLDIPNFFYYGTLGCRVKDRKGGLYVLSNNHVIANENTAAIGSPVVQPGTYNPDTGGTGLIRGEAQTIGYLRRFVPIVHSNTFNPSRVNRVDAAIASCAAANVGNTTLPNGYGWYHSRPVEAYLTQRVQKYGATTGHTRGYVSDVNLTVSISYDAGTAWFVDQIGVIALEPPWSTGGDSGSLVVTDSAPSTRRPRPEAKYPVGLHFAGAAGIWGIENPIGEVLKGLNVTIDGKE